MQAICTSLQIDNHTIQFLTGRMLFLMPNEQCQSIEGICLYTHIIIMEKPRLYNKPAAGITYYKIYKQPKKKSYEYIHTQTHTFNGPFSGTTQVSQYEKGKTNLDFTEARDSEWQWH